VIVEGREATESLGIDTEANYRREQLAIGMHDQLRTGDANLVFRFAQSEKLQMRSGLGMNCLTDSDASDFGFNFTYGGDWMPVRPWVISADIDWGRISHATLLHGRLTTGIQVNRVEVYTGYDHFNVGNVRINSLIGGVRISF